MTGTEILILAGLGVWAAILSFIGVKQHYDRSQRDKRIESLEADVKEFPRAYVMKEDYNRSESRIESTLSEMRADIKAIRDHIMQEKHDG